MHRFRQEGQRGPKCYLRARRALPASRTRDIIIRGRRFAADGTVTSSIGKRTRKPEPSDQARFVVEGDDA